MVNDESIGPREEQIKNGVSQREEALSPEKGQGQSQPATSSIRTTEITSEQIAREHELFNQSVEKIKYFQHRIPTNISEEESKVAPKIEDPEIPLRTVDEVKAYLNGISQKLSETQSGAKLLSDLTFQTAVAQLTALKADTPEAIQEVNGILEITGSLLERARQSTNSIVGLKEAAKTAREGFYQARLAELGLESHEQLSDRLHETWDKMHTLEDQYYGLGRLFNRTAIQKINSERAPLEGVLHQITDLSWSDPTSSIYVSSSDNYELDRQGKKIAERAVEIINGRFRFLLEQIPPPKLEGAIDERIIGSLTEDFGQKQVLPYIAEVRERAEKGVEEGLSFYQKELAALSGEENTLKTLDLIAKGSALPLYGSYSNPEEKGYWDELRNLPQTLAEVVQRSSQTHYHPANENYVRMADYVEAQKQRPPALALKDAYIDITGKLNELGLAYHQDWSLSVQFSEIRSAQGKAEEFASNFDLKRWQVFKTNSLIRERFSTQELDQAERNLTIAVARELFISREDSPEASDLANKLFVLKTTETIPIYILEAFRDPRYLLNVAYGSPEQTPLFQFVKSLDPIQIEELRAKSIPGLVEVIELIKNNPDKFRDRELISPLTEDREENPVYTEVQSQLTRLAIHYLKTEDVNTQIFAVNVMKRLGVDLGEGYGEMVRLLETTASPELRQAIIQSAYLRATGYYDSDFKAAEVMLKVYNELDSDSQSKIKEFASQLVKGLIGKDLPQAESLKALSDLLGMETSDLERTLGFMDSIERLDPYHEFELRGHFQDYVNLSKNPQVLPLFEELRKYGHRFEINQTLAVPELLDKRSEIVRSIVDIRKYFPEFRYQLQHSLVFDQANTRYDQVFATDPYEVLANRIGFKELVTKFAEIKQQGVGLGKDYSTGILMWLRRSDPTLRTEAAVNEETKGRFSEAIDKFVTSFQQESETKEFSDLFFKREVLHFLARQPERIDEVLDIRNLVPGLFPLLGEGGPLYSNRDLIISDIFSNGDFLRRAQQVERIFTRRTEYWKQLYMFTNTRIGDQLATANTPYPITDIAGVPLENLVERHREVKETNGAQTTRLESAVPNAEVRNSLLSGQQTSVPFSELSGEYKRLVFRDYLRRSIETSRSDESKSASDQRNRSFTSENLLLNPGFYLHGSAIDNLESVLLNGNLPREALGEGAAVDAFPFQVDFTRLEIDYLESSGNTQSVITNSLSARYGTSGELGVEGQVFYIYDRAKSNWEAGKEFTTQGADKGYHALLFGSVPATEISAIVVRSPETILARAKQAVLENGFYIPIYDLDGHNLFTVQEYDTAFMDENLSAPVLIWDFSLKTGEQLGSNPGGEFTVPTSSGPVRFYVKFASSEGNDHIWNEQLADSLYRELGISVPETRVVKVEGSYGHASAILPVDSQAKVDLNSGFVADALLANWDILYNPANSINSNGVTYRIDNGGALLFRARGQRKAVESFGANVAEVETGENRERLGFGMRQEYQGLDNQGIINQARALEERLTDERLNQLVDSVRLKIVDRDYLKATLKARRDYILGWVSSNLP